MVYDTQGERVLLFGGNAYTFTTITSDETWAYDGSAWTELTPALSPPARKLHAMAYDKDRDEVVLFGGVDQSDSDYFNDTWVYDGETWEQRTPPASPPADWGMSMAYDSARDEVVMFGGIFAGDRTWVWDGTTWEERFPAVSPRARYSSGMAYARSRQQVVLYGGTNGRFRHGDTWAWDGETWALEALTASPSPRSNAAMSAFGKRVVLFGGSTDTDHSVDETWVLRADKWAQIAADPPPSRVGATMAYDSARKEAVLFSGVGESSEFLGDTWLLQR